MPDIEPFCGLRYNLERVGDISSVISPPYDVISPQEQQLYYHRSQYNIVRLELGEELPLDSFQNNRYTRAAATLKEWLRDGVLIREKCPALYIFEHCFLHRGQKKTRWGLTCRVRLEDWCCGGIYPHEVTLEEYKQDRLQLLRSCQVNLSPILGILHGEDDLLSFLPHLAREAPILSVRDDSGVCHNIWVVTDERDIAQMCRLPEGKSIYIADGHHRYETALAYCREQSVLSPGAGGAFNFVMMTLVDSDDPGLMALPTHRLVRLPGVEDLSWLEEKLAPLFSIEVLRSSHPILSENVAEWLDVLGERGHGGTVIGLYGLRQDAFLLLTPREEAVGMMPSERSACWKELDVSILHCIILRNLMEINTSEKEKVCLGYTQDALEATHRVDSGEYQLTFLLNLPSVSSVLSIADASDRMPQKTTYFYPKLPAGMVMNPLWD